MGVTGEAPRDPQGQRGQHLPTAVAAGAGSSGLVSAESPKTPKKRSLLGRIGVSAVKVCPGLGFRVSTPHISMPPLLGMF